MLDVNIVLFLYSTFNQGVYFMKKTIKLFIAVFCFAIIIACGDVSSDGEPNDKEKLNSAGTRGSCYTHYPGTNSSLCLEFKQDDIIPETCEEIETETGYPTEYKKNCPANSVLECNENEHINIYIYGSTYGLTCDYLYDAFDV
jgi:hypothetical protein